MIRLLLFLILLFLSDPGFAKKKRKKIKPKASHWAALTRDFYPFQVGVGLMEKEDITL